MSRKVCGVMTGWLAAASVAVAQTGGTTGACAAPKGKTLSPYYATASTVDWSDETPPELLPPVSSTPVVPAAPAPKAMPAQPVQQQAAAAILAAAAATLPATAPPPVAAAPAGPATPAAKPAAVPAAPAGSCPSCGIAPTCNCNVQQQTGPCGPAGQFWGMPSCSSGGPAG